MGLLWGFCCVDLMSTQRPWDPLRLQRPSYRTWCAVVVGDQERGRAHKQMSSDQKPWIFGCIRGSYYPVTSYMGILISRHKDHYETNQDFMDVAPKLKHLCLQHFLMVQHEQAIHMYYKYRKLWVKSVLRTKTHGFSQSSSYPRFFWLKENTHPNTSKKDHPFSHGIFSRKLPNRGVEPLAKHPAAPVGGKWKVLLSPGRAPGLQHPVSFVVGGGFCPRGRATACHW